MKRGAVIRVLAQLMLAVMAVAVMRYYGVQIHITTTDEPLCRAPLNWSPEIEKNPRKI